MMGSPGDHGSRKHSKFSASGALRWVSCPGSVKLSEGLPDKTSVWAEEGTRAHEVLEACLVNGIKTGMIYSDFGSGDMYTLGRNAAKFIIDLSGGNEILIEDKVYLDFIHPEAFGTYDAAIPEYYGTLHVFDYKYGAGVPVSVKDNLQMIFYGLGLAHKFGWDFQKVRLWIIQPRIKGYDGPTYWDLTIPVLKIYEKIFRNAIARVEREPENYVEGSWCHWCKAKNICPLKAEKKYEKAKSIFTTW